MVNHGGAGELGGTAAWVSVHDSHVPLPCVYVVHMDASPLYLSDQLLILDRIYLLSLRVLEPRLPSLLVYCVPLSY